MPDADDGVLRAPDLKSGVTRVEVVLLGVARAVGDVALAIGAEHGAVGVDDHDAVVGGVVGPLVDAQREDDAELGGDAAEVLDRRMALDRAGPVEVLGEHVLAEVRPFEQLGDQHELGALGGGLAHQPLGRGDVGIDVVDHRHLDRRDRQSHAPTLEIGVLLRRSVTCRVSDR